MTFSSLTSRARPDINWTTDHRQRCPNRSDVSGRHGDRTSAQSAPVIRYPRSHLPRSLYPLADMSFLVCLSAQFNVSDVTLGKQRFSFIGNRTDIIDPRNDLFISRAIPTSSFIKVRWQQCHLKVNRPLKPTQLGSLMLVSCNNLNNYCKLCMVPTDILICLIDL